MWKVRVFTLYPELFPGHLASGLFKKALDKKIWSLEVINIRDYAKDKHRTVDDTPFGGGSGMLMRADILASALDKNILDKREPVIYLTPKGKSFNQSYAKNISNVNVNIICGHFEGVDERILETRKIEPKKEEPKKEAPKVATPKVEPKKEEPKKEAPKVATPKVKPKKEEPKKK